VKILKQLQIFLFPPTEYIRVKPEAKVVFKQYLEQFQVNYAQKYDWIQLESGTEEISSFFRRILARRPPPKRSLDQFDATIDSILRRVRYLETEGVLVGTKLLFLGDYDLTSLAVAIRGGPKEIHVLDIDLELLSLIREIAQENSFPITIHHQDLRLGFPKELLSSFHAVFTDPPFTLNGGKLFLIHAINALVPGGTIYSCFGYSPNNLFIGIQFQSILNELGLVARTILENFNVYSKAQSIGSTSHLFKLIPLKYPLKKISFLISNPIYSGYKESEDLTELIGQSTRFQLVKADVISSIVNEILKENPKTIGFINSPYGSLQNELAKKNISIKCIELDALAENLTYPINTDQIEMIFPPPSKSKVAYDTLVVESPCYALDLIRDWMQFKFCKNIFLMLPAQLNSIEVNPKAISLSFLTKLLLTSFWDWTLLLTIMPEAFEPRLFQTGYFYKGSLIPKDQLIAQPQRFILREILEQPTKTVANALREALIRFYQVSNFQLPKRQSKILIEQLELPSNVLPLQVQQLADNEMELLIKILSQKMDQIMKNE
jgi:predicted methyltransferase/16S rRNA A1518/A1519 N6-dimethyltransferase RsmA/KsgA/DIM1 with predicted DNA glycosylase/AP lyase activity